MMYCEPEEKVVCTLRCDGDDSVAADDYSEDSNADSGENGW